ncbi:MAG: permease-like cell division protein FtsX [Candidatus Saccharimonadales bacterium]|nr:permease-like cell division protein FtsX [Candidatus Saccharimonadales bacterium]
MAKRTYSRKLVMMKRISHQGVSNFIRNAWLSTAATAVMVVTLTIILSSIAINSILTDTIDDIASNITVSVYLNDDISEDQRSELKTTLESSFNVESVTYVSKQDALAEFQETFENEPELLEAFTLIGNPLPESLEVSVVDLSLLDSVVQVAEEPQFEGIVDETSVNEDSREDINDFANTQDFVTYSSIAAAVIFAVISVLIIFNTIRMAVFSRSDEIEIMKLIGATPWYIRGPFLFEAALYGLLAGLISATLVLSTMVGLGPQASDDLIIDPTITEFSDNAVMIFVVCVTGGIVLGLTSSLFAMSRYLRLKKW